MNNFKSITYVVIVDSETFVDAEVWKSNSAHTLEAGQNLKSANDIVVEACKQFYKHHKCNNNLFRFSLWVIALCKISFAFKKLPKVQATFIAIFTMGMLGMGLKYIDDIDLNKVAYVVQYNPQTKTCDIKLKALSVIAFGNYRQINSHVRLHCPVPNAGKGDLSDMAIVAAGQSAFMLS